MLQFVFPQIFVILLFEKQLHLGLIKHNKHGRSGHKKKIAIR